MLYLPHSLAGEFCIWVKVLLNDSGTELTVDRNNRDSSPLRLSNSSGFNVTFL